MKDVDVSLESEEAVITMEGSLPSPDIERIILDTAWCPRLRGYVEKIAGKLR